MLEILTADEMKKADASTIAGGISGIQLMTTAGVSLAKEIIQRYKPCPVLVLCGPGNNGGDGFIVAQHLKKEGWPVRVACMVKRTALKGDAAQAAQKWDGDVESLNSNLSVHQTGLIVDAIFGISFDGALPPELALLFDKIRTRKLPVVAVDIPTGVNATTGQADPAALRAEVTVTFCRKKFGHVMLPAKSFCGKVIVAAIGVTDQTVAAAGTSCFENNPALWLRDFPLPAAEGHKYSRGHALVYGGEKRTGAACLAAAAAQKIGAGLVTIASSESAFPIYATYRTSIMVDVWETPDDLKSLLRDERKNAVIVGPGAGADEQLKKSVETILSFNKSGVIDADVFTAYQKTPKDLFSKLSPRYVLTPHEGEFEWIFGAMEGGKIERARKAAKISNAIVLLKGADTVIAAPDGATIVNTNAPPTLAMAGSGDVLAGFIAGLIAQGMPPFMAAAAGAWLHGETARVFGLGLTAEDLISHISQVLNSFFPAAPENR